MYTKLKEYLPKLSQASDMDELAELIYKNNYTYHKKHNIPKLVFDLAEAGDYVCINILSTMELSCGKWVVI